jgi:hypothetical protein
MASPKIKASVWVEGDLWDPAELTALLGITPSSVRVAGDKGRGPDGHLRPPHTWWEYKVQRDSYETEELIEEVLRPFAGKQDLFSSFVTQHDLSAGVDCVIEIYGEKAILEASRSQVAFVASLSAKLGFDTYTYEVPEGI